MSLFANPEFLKERDSFYYDHPTSEFKPGDRFNVKTGTLSYNHSFEKKSDFSPLSNPQTAIIKYVERSPMNINLFGMPVEIKKYRIYGSMFSSNVLPSFVRPCYVESMNDLPNFYFLPPKNEVVIQETNSLSSVLIQDTVEEDGEFFILSLFKSTPEYTCYITKPTVIFTSGHIQPKIEISVALPKQEKSLVENIRHGIEDEIKTIALKNVFKCKIGKRARKLGSIKKKRKRKKSTKNTSKIKNVGIINLKEYLSTQVDLIQIRSLREVYVKREIEEFRRFFNYLFKHGNFTDQNNMITILYTLSCFPLHDNEMSVILRKIENFLNNCFLVQSVNFFNSVDKSKLGKQFFMIKFLNIFKKYFDSEELNFVDYRLESYIKNFGKENYSNKKAPMDLSISEMNLVNVEKKKKKFINTKKKIIQFIYFLENEHLKRGGDDDKNEFDKKSFYKFIDKILPEKKQQQLETSCNDDEMELELYNGILKDVEAESFNYDFTDVGAEKLKQNIAFRILSKSKSGNRDKKLKDEKTRGRQIRYSKIFFENSPNSWGLHKNFKDKISNPYGVFLNYKKKLENIKFSSI